MTLIDVPKTIQGFFLTIPPPHDDDAKGWKEVAIERGEQYNRLADQVEQAWLKVESAEAQLEAYRAVRRIHAADDDQRTAVPRGRRLQALSPRCGKNCAPYLTVPRSLNRGRKMMNDLGTKLFKIGRLDDFAKLCPRCKNKLMPDGWCTSCALFFRV